MKSPERAHRFVFGSEMPPGIYWVGDPCYGGRKDTSRWHSTSYGDGSYDYEISASVRLVRHTADRKIWVDSGKIGIEPISDLSDSMHVDLGIIVEIGHEFDCWHEGGELHFDGVMIRT
ncbi:MAG: hypothetical protein J2P53_03675 [Bradyrhizobiaceae bacterium]|nr:hypothetical protein [Bradyrhizobiaceae bacterium]